jgi:CDP-glycerol glycerophosphotransferase
VALPHAKFPDTEEILLVSDILVCDWSSIAFDYLVLDRPTIFLDVEAPFAKGLSLDAGHRFGAVVSNMDALLERLERYLVEPECYTREFSAKCSEIKARVYDDYADGNATARCVARLGQHLAPAGTSR